MKTKIKTGSLILSAVLTLIIAIFALVVSAAEGDVTKPEIKGYNLSAKENVYLDIAVDFGEIPASAAGFGVLVFEDAVGVKLPAAFNHDTYAGFEAAYPGAAGNLTSEKTDTVGGKECYIFQYKGLAAKQMTDEVYIVAYVCDSEGKYTYSDVNTYSIREYADTMKAENADNEKLVTLLNKMLNYGAEAQKYFGYRLDRLANVSAPGFTGGDSFVGTDFVFPWTN